MSYLPQASAGDCRNRCAAILTFRLFVEPLLQRCEIIDDGACVHLPRSGQCLERVLPRPRLPHREHRGQPLTRLLAVVGGAAVERDGATGGLCQRPMKLELQDVRQEIARVRGVVGDVVLGAGVEELLTTRRRRGDALVLQPQIPPRAVVPIGFTSPANTFHRQLVDQQTEGEKRDLSSARDSNRPTSEASGPCRASRS